MKWKQISIQFRKHHDCTLSGGFATEITAAITGFGNSSCTVSVNCSAIYI